MNIVLYCSKSNWNLWGNKMPIAVKGGFGDFLQCLPFILEHPDHYYLVASHQGGVTKFFASLGIKVEEISLGKLGNVDTCPRTLFFSCNPFPLQEPLFDKSPVIGVHLGGSAYSVSVEKRFGFPPKVLPVAVFDGIVAALKANFLLFGSADELSALGVKETPNIKFVCDEDIAVSLSHVAGCDALIGSDSVFKTMSAMLGIPTAIWVGDYRDDFRDGTFIDPYVKAGVMAAFRYRDLSNDEEIRNGIHFSLKFIGYN